MKKINLFSLIFPLLILRISGFYAGMRYNENIFIPWGDQENTLKHRSYPGTHNGPSAFQIIDDRIIILDSENHRLKVFNQNGLISSKKLPVENILDFYQEDGSLLMANSQYIYRDNGEKVLIVAEESNPRKMFQGFYKQKGVLCVKHSDGRRRLLSKKLSKAVISDIRVTRELPDRVKVAINGQPINIYVPEVGSVDYLGSTSQDLHYIYAESITCHAPLAVDRFVFLINAAGDIKSKIKLPPQKFTYVFREFDVDDKGNLYHMHSAKDGIHIIRWEYDPDLPYTEAEYPKKFQEVYHFNDFAKKEPGISSPVSLDVSYSSISRAQALARADKYVRHIWTATPANIGSTRTVITPLWVKVGQNRGIPYSWGGFATVSGFDVNIESGKLAGNTKMLNCFNRCVGVDCSGFVTRCWDLTARYTTNDLYYNSKKLNSFYDLLPADAIDYPGSHVILFVEWAANGALLTVESTITGNPGYKVRYFISRLSDFTNYKPIRRRNIQKCLAPHTDLLSAVLDTDSVSLNWIADNSIEFSGFNIYRKKLEEDEYSIISTVPKNISEIKFSQQNNMHYEYKIAAFHDSINTPGKESDIYAVSRKSNGPKILIVDGFDCFTHSYNLRTHDFAARTGEIMNNWNVGYECCANEAVISGDVSLKKYEFVWWLLGDEGPIDETFSDAEQDIVESYLQNGGKLFVSGSELAWDLDFNGDDSDKVFIHDYLKTAYAADDAGNYVVNGHIGSTFEGLSLNYSEEFRATGTFSGDYADVFKPNGGSASVLNYGNDQTAAICFEGFVPEGKYPCKVMVMGFPFETITTNYSKKELAGYVLKFMGFDVRANIEQERSLKFALYHNYPNPFNSTTTVSYEIPQALKVILNVYDIQGNLVDNLVSQDQQAGYHSLEWDASNLSSGLYLYQIKAGSFTQIRKCMVIK